MHWRDRSKSPASSIFGAVRKQWEAMGTCRGALPAVLTLFRPLAGVKSAPLVAEYYGKYDGIAALKIAALYRHRTSAALCERAPSVLEV